MSIHWFHKWSVWSAPYYVIGSQRQQRRCLICNRADVRFVWWSAFPQAHETIDDHQEVPLDGREE